MDLKGKTYWEMEKESISYIRKNESVWMKYAVIATNVNTLEKNEHDLDLAFKAQDKNDPAGYVVQKNEQFTLFFKKIYKLGRRLSLYAKQTGDKVLQNDADIPESTLVLLPEKEALLKCHSLIQLGYDYLPKTADLLITADYLKSLSDELAQLEKIHPLIGMVTNDRKSARRSIKDLISEAHFILDKLDDGFEGLIDDEEFINSWFAVRKIKGRHKLKEKSVTIKTENN